MGIGATETFPKIKLPSATGSQSLKFRQTISAYSRVKNLSIKIISAVAPSLKQTRLITHACVLSAIALILAFGSTAGNVHSTAVSLMASNTTSSATLDETTAATVAAKVAVSSNLIVSAEASREATVLNSQVALPTTDDGTLAKRQVVTTAGDVTRNVTAYQVNHGDTLSAIASKFGITTSTLRWANDIEDVDSLKPGQALTILPVSGLMYIVQSGDTAESLASKYVSNAAQILSYNNAEVKGLKVGQKIIIPDGIKPEVVNRSTVAAVTKTARSTVVAAVSQVAEITRPFIGGGNSYAFGYCTYYAKGRRPDIGSFWGNAASWGYAARNAGYAVNRTPSPGAIAWTTAGYYGHVAVVDQVSGSSVLVSEMNYYGPGGGWNRVSSRWTSASEWSGFIH